ncbi:uncharacterized protein EV420DRAFT_1482347 [Desarmillaria tabescens]|uniref:A-kinase anchor protein 7-like phosphoesterase domain-containing protein n=1 Tax=Armillaria tabescens TaxID=1929756 RepID=A0AA39K4G6_ARMTA|nr:uncharacterized protein EV420DRAFT_1482347 [Desarmillaria tabescens]KAK0452008.1 hypothetical protein EV420DRAFT_1482347 [Desarmillaria tabescens]
MARPTHFLSIPLGQVHPTLRAKVAEPHAALNLPVPDCTLLAGPRRVHLTLGVMNLTPETLPTALDLLHRLSTLLLLTDMAPTVTLDTLDVLRRESRRRAHVLWVGPSQPEPLFSRINEIFRMLECFGMQESEFSELPMAVTMGSYDAPRVHLCEMGSWDTDGASIDSNDLTYINYHHKRRRKDKSIFLTRSLALKPAPKVVLRDATIHFPLIRPTVHLRILGSWISVWNGNAYLPFGPRLRCTPERLPEIEANNLKFTRRSRGNTIPYVLDAILEDDPGMPSSPEFILTWETKLEA